MFLLPLYLHRISNPSIYRVCFCLETTTWSGKLIQIPVTRMRPSMILLKPVPVNTKSNLNEAREQVPILVVSAMPLVLEWSDSVVTLMLTWGFGVSNLPNWLCGLGKTAGDRPRSASTPRLEPSSMTLRYEVVRDEFSP